MEYGHGLYPSSAVTASRCTGNSGVRNIRFAFPGALAALLIIANITTTTWAKLPPPASSTSIAITPSEASFGNVAVGTSRSQAIKITNNGSARVAFTQLTVSGSGFTLANVPPSLTLAAGTSITFNVVFTPRSASLHSASIPLVSGGAVVALVSLSGTGTLSKPAALAPAVVPSSGITIIPSSANFGSVTVGISNSQTIKITNIGGVKLTFPSLTLSGSGFSLANVPPSLTLAAGTSITFNVIFTPRSASLYSASIPLTLGGKAMASIPLSGTGVSTKLSLAASTSSLNFGNVSVGTKASSGVTLTNKGNSNVTISGVTVKGPGFAVSGIVNGTVLAPGQSATLNASFDPTAIGTTTGTISIASNASSSPTISLSGTGIQPTTASVSLHWQAVSNILGYYVYRASTSGGPYTKVSSSLIPSLQFVDLLVAPGKTYYYVVTSVDSSNAESSYSNQAEASIPVAN
jgi:P pilus assembly chaperone PapD